MNRLGISMGVLVAAVMLGDAAPDPRPERLERALSRPLVCRADLCEDPGEELIRDFLSRPSADPAWLPLLVRALSRYPTLAGQAFEKLGPPMVPVLSGELTHLPSDAREAALHTLGRMGLAAKPALPVVVQQMDHRDARIRAAAVSALAAIGGERTETRLVLQRAARDESSLVRESLAAALGKGVSWSRAYERMLARGLRDDDADVRATAIASAGMRAQEASALLPDLLLCLSDPDPSNRRQAALALALMEPPPAVRGRLWRYLSDPDASVRAVAQRLLAAPVQAVPPEFSLMTP